MLRRRHINAGQADPSGRIARFAVGFADAARWPFERIAWLAERRLIWPLRERAAGLAPAAGAAALGLVAVAAVAVGVLALSGGGEDGSTAAQSARLAVERPAPQPRPPAADEANGPTLQGVAPSFSVGRDGAATEPPAADGDSGESSSSAAAPTDEAEASGEGFVTGDEGEAGAATASGAKPVPAGPAAMKVARRFAEAFVFYEIGKKQARARTVFGETAAPNLSEALAERPPRLPADAEVPKAKVLNLVPGPRQGKAYTVSVSLLRVGLTSELRLEMQKQGGAWLVTDVRG